MYIRGLKKDIDLKIMKRKYRIIVGYDISKDMPFYEVVMVWAGFIDITIKQFIDKDSDFAKREAEELLEKLNEK